MSDTFSECAYVTSGLPQSSVLEPALFLISINDMPECIEDSQICFFADDTKISKEIYNNEDW